jgi:hypothetical protein
MFIPAHTLYKEWGNSIGRRPFRSRPGSACICMNIHCNNLLNFIRNSSIEVTFNVLNNLIPKKF